MWGPTGTPMAPLSGTTSRPQLHSSTAKAGVSAVGVKWQMQIQEERDDSQQGLFF